MRVLLATQSLILPEDRKYFALALYQLKQAVLRVPDLADTDVTIIDKGVLETDYARLVLAEEHDVVGFSCECWNTEVHIELARQIKECFPQTVILFGGHSAYYRKEELLDGYPWIDAVINGEGETALVDLLRALRANASMDAIAGVCTRRNPSAAMAPAVDHPPLPFNEPSVPLSEYYLMESMRGCMFKCEYCTWWVGQRKVRHYPEHYIEANLQHALESGYKKVWLIDAAINFSNAPLERLAGCVRRVDPDQRLKFWYFVQWTQFNQQQMPFFEAFGVDTIHIGLESANPDVLAKSGRNWDEKRVRECVGSLATIATPVVDIILGMPGDTPDGFRRTLDFVESLDVNVLAFRLMLYPGSGQYQRREQLGLDIRGGLMPFVSSTPTFSRDELDSLTEIVRERTYFDPKSKRYFLYEPPDYWEGGKPAIEEFRK